MNQLAFSGNYMEGAADKSRGTAFFTNCIVP